MSYYLAASLVKLRDQINARWPDRDKSSDGWIGDASHQALKSDHNPDYSNGGVVRAIDIDEDGINTAEIMAAVVGDPRVAYVIYEYRIWTHAMGWQPYGGNNGHTKHIHISIRHTKVAEVGGAWDLGGDAKRVGNTESNPVLKAWPARLLQIDGYFGKVTVTAIQRMLAIHPNKNVRYAGRIDGDFGKMTRTAAQRWLEFAGTYRARIDGEFGAMSVRALQSFLVEKGELPNRAYVDGRWGNVTTKALQRYINSQAAAYNKQGNHV